MIASFKGGDVMDERTKRLQKDDWKLLRKIISDHQKKLKEIEAAQSIFDGEYELLKRQPKRPDDPNHKIIINFSKLIIRMKANYMFGKPVTYDIPQIEGIDQQLIKEFNEEFTMVLEDNDDHAVDYLNTKRGLIAGAAVVLFYFDDLGDIKYRSYTVNECIPIVDARGELRQVIHVFTDEEDKSCIEIYDSQAVTYLVKDGDKILFDSRKDVNPAEHYLPIVPAAIYVNGEYAKPKYDPIPVGPSELDRDIRTILENYSQLISDNSNRLEIFCDPYLLFLGAKPNKDEVLGMRKARAIYSENPDSKVSYLTWEQSNDSIEFQATTLLDRLFEITDTPKIYKQEAISNLSSVAIRQLYTPLDNNVNEKEIYVNQYERRKIMVLTFMLNAKRLLSQGKNPIEHYQTETNLFNWRWVYWENHRSLPQNEKDLVDLLMSSKGTLSDFTILKHHPLVENVHEEVKLIRQEAINAPKVDLTNIDDYLQNQDDKIQSRSFEDDVE